MQPQSSRRRFIAMLAAGASAPILAACSGGPAQAKGFPIQFTEAEWRKRQTPEQFYILRQKGTEAFSCRSAGGADRQHVSTQTSQDARDIDAAAAGMDPRRFAAHLVRIDHPVDPGGKVEGRIQGEGDEARHPGWRLGSEGWFGPFPMLASFI